MPGAVDGRRWRWLDRDMGGWHRRPAAVLALAVLMTGLATRGLCSMDRATSGGDGHGCCRAGLTAAPPPCCMAAVSEPVPIMAAARFELTVPSVVAGLVAIEPASKVRLVARLSAAEGGRPPHAPPPRAVLRI